MFEFALAIGIYSYLILALGLSGSLYFYPSAITTVVFWGFVLIVKIKKGIKIDWKALKKIFSDKLVFLLVLIFLSQAFVNLIGALSPELSFDALWYHLTLAKLYAAGHEVFHIPGGLLYYSSMPRLAEMLYTASLLFGDEILAKLIHWSFGILSAIALFRLIKYRLGNKYGFIGVVIFYTLLIVGWQSTTAYVDLARTFFETLTLYYFLRWFEKRNNLLLKSGLMMGLSLSVKHLGLGTLFIFLTLIFVFSRERLKNIVQFLGASLGAAFPWYILSYLNTGNPFYPLFSGWFETNQIGNWKIFWQTHGPIAFFLSPWKITFHLDNLMSPVFLIFLPLVLAKIWRQDKTAKVVAFYCFLGFLFWFFTPPSSARYLLPFTPAFIFVCLKVLASCSLLTKKLIIISVILACFLNLGSRTIAARKFLPVAFGKQTKDGFLSQNLNFDYGDFYDTDGYFKRNIKKNDLVLIYNIHNLYYVDFPFVHESWVKPGTYFTHVLIKGKELPKKFGNLKLLYQNKTTKVKLYRFGGVYQ